MRNFLTTKDIAELSGYRRAQIWNWAKAGKIPGQRVKHSARRVRFVDSPEIREWCNRRRGGLDAWMWTVIEATVLAVVARDCSANPEKIEKIIAQETQRQLDESDDPDRLLKKWELAMKDGNPENLPPVDLLRVMGSDILAEMMRQLVDSEHPGRLLTRWQRACADQRCDDLPYIP